ncbi:putative lipoprotein [Clostridium sporogenes]|nr:putative lipoprotein [Clostridium sporogenes]MBZ1327955.1 hypothetical protein [Clostridium botulinum]KRU25456.1 hypothetical protein WG71_30330 [Clostridium sporogenes]KRU35161.1 putative lipoprotein [Clostridium sporogenes]KRU47598.1 putative lipoprotein [Clostridium sporogenes]
MFKYHYVSRQSKEEQESERSETIKKGMYYISQQEVKKKLKAPSTAEFPVYEESFMEKIDDKHYKISAYFDAQNGFGAKIRGYYNCDAEYKPNSSMSYYINNIQINEN